MKTNTSLRIVKEEFSSLQIVSPMPGDEKDVVSLLRNKDVGPMSIFSL